MKYMPLILANLFRKKLRTTLTIGSFAVAMFLFGLLIIVHGAFNQGVDVAGADRLDVINKVSIIQSLPYAYHDQILRIPGVKAITFDEWFGGVYQDEKNFFPQFAVDPENQRVVYPEFAIPDDQWKAFLEDREGAIAGAGIAKRFGWKVGDRIPIKGAIYPGAWEFNIRGIYQGTRDNDDLSQFWFHYKYLDERRQFGKGTIGWYIVKLNGPDDAARVAKAIDQTFANSPYETKTETEKALAADFAKQIGDISFLMMSIGGIVFFTLLLVTGNTMAIAVRERVGELAVLKAVGFTDRFVMLLVLGESVLISTVGGLLGLVACKLSTPLLEKLLGGFLALINLPLLAILLGIAMALTVGILAGILPATSAMRLRVVDALRRV
ncbi:MAG: ABC transporter permease [Candidatus Acidiferrales bacterium]